VLAYLIRRIVWAIVLMFVLSVCTFVVFYVLPGSGSTVGRRFGEETIQFDESVHLHGSLVSEYGQYVWNLAHGSLGYSNFRKEAVTTVLLRAAPVTLSLVAGGMLFALLLAIPLGILSAIKARTLFDKAAVAFVLIGVSAHPIWLSLVVLYLLSYKAGLFPVGGGYCDVIHPSITCGGPVQWAYHLVLPWFVFGLVFAAMYTRMVRAAVLETLEEDYVRTARAKGASPWHVIRKHVLRNAMLPVVTMLGMDVGIALAGSVYIESIFGLPGLGKTVLQSIPRRDLPVLMGIAFYASLAVILVNLMIDTIYALIDPRIGLSWSEAEPVPRRAREETVLEPEPAGAR
jgi:peptide/nickel transport system permease protein